MVFLLSWQVCGELLGDCIIALIALVSDELFGKCIIVNGEFSV